MLQERKMWIAAGAVIIIALLAGFLIGRSTAGTAAIDTAADSTTATTTTVSAGTAAPQYGDTSERDSFVSSARGSLPPGSTITDDDLLATGDSVCADLEGFTNQGRDAHYAIRILWTDELRYLDSIEIATYGVVLAAAPEYLCPEYRVLAEDIAYWLGI